MTTLIRLSALCCALITSGYAGGAAAQQCVGGRMIELDVDGLPVPICGCPGGQLLCSGTCKTVDVNNCGGCGTQCLPGHVCNNYECQCPAGKSDCLGQCVSLNTDARNCGACGVSCGGGKICSGGACVCPSGTADCGGVCRNLSTDSGNCGSCGRACDSGFVCSAGACTCSPQQVNCNGACRDTKTDEQNCGACGNVCASGSTCCNGTCTSLTSDSANCGSCGNACPVTCSSSRASCSASRCAPVTRYPLLVENNLRCMVALENPLAASSSEALACVQSVYPAFSVGTPTGPYAFCAHLVIGRNAAGRLVCVPNAWTNVFALSSADAKQCVVNNNQGGAVVYDGSCPFCSLTYCDSGACVPDAERKALQAAGAIPFF